MCVCMRVARRWVCEHPERACLSRGCARTRVIAHPLRGPTWLHRASGIRLQAPARTIASSTQGPSVQMFTQGGRVWSGTRGALGQSPSACPGVRDRCRRGGLCPVSPSALRRRDMLPGTPVQVFPEFKSDLHQGLLWGTVCVCAWLQPNMLRCFFLPS